MPILTNGSIAYSKQEFSDSMRESVFSRTIARDLVSKGIYFTLPYERTRGGVYFIQFNDDSPTSHMLAVAPAGKSRRLKSLANTMLAHATVPTMVISLDQSLLSLETQNIYDSKSTYKLNSPAGQRERIDSLVSCLSGNESKPKRPLLVIIDGLETIYTGCRSNDTKNALTDKIRTMMNDSTTNGTHVCILQSMDKVGVDMLESLGVDFDLKMSLGRLSAICSQIVFDDGYGTTVPNGRWLAGFKDQSVTGLVKIPRD